MRDKSIVLKGTLLILYVFLGLIFTAYSPANPDYTFKYYFVLFSYFVVAGVWFCFINKFGIYIFEPVTMVMVLTIITYSIEPLISMISNSTDLMGFYVYDGCIYATTLYIVSSLVFLFVYYSNNKQNIEENEMIVKISEKEAQQIVFFAYFFALVGVMVTFIDLLKQGYDLSYILSLGLNGEYQETDEEIGVFINLRYFMIPAFLYLDEYGKKKIPVLIMRFIAIMCLYIRAKRWIIIILILSPLVYKSIKNKKIPKVKTILIFFVFCFCIIGFMQYVRDYISQGLGYSDISFSDFSLSYIWSAFAGNFDLYKTFYGAVEYFPKQHFYLMGQQLVFLTLVTCIPRVIWPSKPTSAFSLYKPYFMGEGAVRGCWAYAQLTEFYVEYGVIGVILCFGLFAEFCKKLKNMYVQKRKCDDLVFYSVMFPMLMQLVIRGYMPINFWAIVFIWLPVYTIKNITKLNPKRT